MTKRTVELSKKGYAPYVNDLGLGERYYFCQQAKTLAYHLRVAGKRAAVVKNGMRFEVWVKHKER